MQVDIINKGIQIEEKLFGECFETSEQIEGMKNFLEKGKKKKNLLKKKVILKKKKKFQEEYYFLLINLMTCII